MQIDLTDEEFTTLLFMLGYATGAAFSNGDRQLGRSFVRLANAINKDNSHHTPYEVPSDEVPS